MALPKDRKHFPPVNIRDGGGNVVSWDYNNGEPAEYTGAANKDYNVKTQPFGFFVVPLVTTGTIKVQLWGQTDDESYTFTTEEVDAHTGVKLPARIKKVFAVGTTIARMKIVW